jgi:PAS domain S-box-containing protein
LPGDRFIELALDKDRHVLEVLFQHASEAVTIQDQSGQLIYANDRAAELMGMESGEEMIDRRSGSILSRYELIDLSGAPVAGDSLPGRRVLKGEPVAEETVGYRALDSGETRWSRVRSSPVKDDVGHVVWAINFFSDITEEVLLEKERDLLSRTNEALGSSLHVEEILTDLAGVIVPELGYWSGVHLIDDGGFISGVASVHPDSTEAQIVTDEADQLRFPLDTSGLQARVARSGKPEFMSLDEGRQLEGQLPDFHAAVERFGLGAVACVPLSAGDRVVGTLTVGRRRGSVGFSSIERRWLAAVAERAGVSLANALLYAHEHETAAVLQRGLVPTQLPRLEGVQIASRYQPQAQISGVGGDFFDVLTPSGDLSVIAVGDIEGKGIPAAAAVGIARHTLRATVALDPTPETVFAQMNEILRGEEPARMCTLAYLVCHRRAGRAELKVSLAGHPPPMVVGADGGVVKVGEPCPPLGFLANLEPYVHEVELGPGDTVIVYTDGFAMGGLAPPESLEPLLAGAHEEDLESLLDRLIAALQSDQPRLRDDVVLLALRMERPDV